MATCVLGRANQEQLLLKHRALVDECGERSVVKHSRIDAAHHQPLCQIGGKPLGHRDRRIWKPLPELPDQLLRGDLREARRKPDAEVSAYHPPQLPKIVPGTLGLQQHTLGMAQHDLPGIGCRDAAPVPHEQGLPQFHLELSHEAA